MIQPFHADFLSGAVAHRLFDIVARNVGKEAVDPADELIFRLIPELRLTIECPRHEPVRIFDRNDTSRYDTSRERIALCDLFDIWRNLVVECRYSGRHPVCLFRCRAEFMRMTKRFVLGSDIFPHIPYSARFQFSVEFGRFILTSEG